MILQERMHKLNTSDLNQEVFNENVLNWISQENLWNLWVPQSHGGLEMSLSKGLEKLKCLAQYDGSLGWTVTLCSGANFFFGNLKKETVDAVFLNPKTPVCFGGSGGVFGTAEKKDGGYVLSGVWKYATGAPYLTHFTLSAKIIDNGVPLVDKDGAPVVRSFVIDKDAVEIIPDWNTMGLKATATHSFKVNNKWVDASYSFIYQERYHEHPIFKIHFAVFADLTLWVNYIGMATHFLEEAKQVLMDKSRLDYFGILIEKANIKVKEYALKIENEIRLGHDLPEIWIKEIHQEASDSVKTFSETIINIFPLLGIRACSESQKLNQIFRDYFTATQHHIFSRK
ncbi:acyl-CoA dehydrogenase [Mariniflexile ostreae]|uniref:Acyl-CoA dehydrogenase n=1 Tax=Mariniflexile ostreae TaxID=1520892 RepID=A0ABV5F6Z9_9FLAO